MKILCSKEEFALLVRECQLCEAQHKCEGCLFSGICTKTDEMNCIEDICRITTEG